KVMVVLDRSGSMQLCGGDAASGACGAVGDPLSCEDGPDGETTTRWEQAVAAITTLTTQNAARIDFGLATYPKPCTEEFYSGKDCTQSPLPPECTCSLQCNWQSCPAVCAGPTLANQPGEVDVPLS